MLLLSSSLWGCELKGQCNVRSKSNKRHPPCEDVSWKIAIDSELLKHIESSSLWGCELKDASRYNNRSFKCVILLVRMWVERLYPSFYSFTRQIVILLVRMWVERQISETIQKLKNRHPPCEDVSWKAFIIIYAPRIQRHPPCEDVSWKISGIVEGFNSVGHPPCEDVSWKNIKGM